MKSYDLPPSKSGGSNFLQLLWYAGAGEAVEAGKVTSFLPEADKMYTLPSLAATEKSTGGVGWCGIGSLAAAGEA